MIQFYSTDQYQQKCERLFEVYKNKIQELIPSAQIEHIGSSAIPHAISKGDLDIYIAVEITELEKYVTILKTLDFQEKQGTFRSHELCMLQSNIEEDVAIQLVAQGSMYECFLTFRDLLRKNPEYVAQYNQLKKQCQHLEMDEYRLKKSEFIEKILHRQLQV